MDGTNTMIAKQTEDRTNTKDQVAPTGFKGKPPLKRKDRCSSPVLI